MKVSVTVGDKRKAVTKNYKNERKSESQLVSNTPPFKQTRTGNNRFSPGRKRNQAEVPLGEGDGTQRWVVWTDES